MPVQLLGHWFYALKKAGRTSRRRLSDAAGMPLAWDARIEDLVRKGLVFSYAGWTFVWEGVPYECVPENEVTFWRAFRDRLGLVFADDSELRAVESAAREYESAARGTTASTEEGMAVDTESSQSPPDLDMLPGPSVIN
eukprot:m51a1_g7463 hypothetical protein (139) ;mRNA; r:154109-154647